jgi:hypothetical protein
MWRVTRSKLAWVDRNATRADATQHAESVVADRDERGRAVCGQ